MDLDHQQLESRHHHRRDLRIIICTSAAFAFARFKFWGRAGGLTFMLALQTFPSCWP